MKTIIIPLLSFVLLLFAGALTQVSSPDYRWVMSVSSLCALLATVGFALSIKRRSRSIQALFGVLSVLGGLITIWSIAFVVSTISGH